MRLIFEKQGIDGSDELKEVLGFIDADLRLSNIKSDLRRATYDLIKVIGLDTYKEILGLYVSGVPNATDTPWTEDLIKELVTLAQYQVAVTGYSYYAPSNDLSHGNNGRTMEMGEHQKMPFEHLLVRDDEALQRRGYRGMDDLLNFLDEHSEVWKSSEEFKVSHRLFVRTVREFDQYFHMDSRLLLIKLSPGISICEKREILPRIGLEQYELIKAKRQGTNENPLTEVEEVLLDLIQEACVNASLAWGLPRMRATLFPEGVMKQVHSERNTIKGRSMTMGNEIEQMVQLFKRDSLRVLQDIEALVAIPDPVDPNTNIQAQPLDYGFDEDDNFVNT